MEIDREGRMTYAFAGFELDLRQAELRRDGVPQHVEPQVFEVIAYLVQHRDRLVTRDDLLESVWGHTFVSPATVNSRLKAARQALGDDGDRQSLIRTVRGRGFRFVGDVTVLQAPLLVAAGHAPAPAAPPLSPRAVDTVVPSAWLPVGRSAELARLAEAFQTALLGRRQLVFVTGEPGVGKSTLVDGFLASVQGRDDVMIARGQCIDQHGAGEPYMPVLEAMGRAGRAPGGAALVGVLATHAPTWLAQMPSLLSADQLEDVQRRTVGSTRERMLREMAEALEAYTAVSPLVVVLEDLHWSDPSTVDLLSLLGRRADPARLLVIATCRAADASETLIETVRSLRAIGRCTCIELQEWDPSAVGAYLSQRFPPAARLRALEPLLRERTGGNPLFVRTLLDAWVEIGHIVERPDGWTLVAPVDEIARTIPQSLRALVEQRADQCLTAGEQEILEAGSVTGPEFTTAVVAAALDRREEDVDEACLSLFRRGRLIRHLGEAEWQDGTLTLRAGFSHQLYQAVLYERIAAPRRARLHARIGLRLEAAYGDGAMEHAAELARHFQQGRADERAIRYLGLAAEQAVKRNAHAEAIGHLTAALELLRCRPGIADAPAIELKLLQMLAPALLVTRGWGDVEAEQVYGRARELARQLDDAPQLARVLYGLAYVHEIRGNYPGAQKLLEERLSLSMPEQGWVSAVETHELLSCTLFHQGAHESALHNAERGLELTPHEYRDDAATELMEPSALKCPAIACSYWAGLALWFLGRPEQAEALVFRAVERATSSRHLLELAIAEAQVARLYQMRREPDRVAGHAERAVTIARRQGYPYQGAVAQTLLGWAEALRGNHRTGLPGIRDGLATQIALGASMEVPYCLGLLADAALNAGDVDAAAHAVDAALARVAANGRSFFWEPELRRLRGVLLARESRHDAEREFRDAVALARKQGALALELRAAVSLARLRAEQQRVAEALDLVRPVLARFNEGLDTPDLRDARELLDGLDTMVSRRGGGPGGVRSNTESVR